MKFLTYLTPLVFLAACAETPSVTRGPAPGIYQPSLIAPPDAPPGTCWNKTETPALVQTVTEDVLVRPAQMSPEGTIQTPPVYRTETQQVIVAERQSTWFQILCSEDLTPDFVTSVQRALQIRGYYSGPVTGKIDAPTQGAIRRFQSQEQIDTADLGDLTVEAAQRMGLWKSQI